MKNVNLENLNKTKQEILPCQVTEIKQVEFEVIKLLKLK